MHRHRTSPRHGDIELGAEKGLLVVGVAWGDPSVQPDLPDTGKGVAEGVFEFAFPCRVGGGGMPGVDAVGGEDPTGVVAREGSEGVPVVKGGCVCNKTIHADGLRLVKGFMEEGLQAGILQMAVRIRQTRRGGMHGVPLFFRQCRGSPGMGRSPFPRGGLRP